MATEWEWRLAKGTDSGLAKERGSDSEWELAKPWATDLGWGWRWAQGSDQALFSDCSLVAGRLRSPLPAIMPLQLWKPTLNEREFSSPEVLVQIQRLRCFRAAAGWLKRISETRDSSGQVGSAFPHKSVKFSLGIKAQLAVKLDGSGVGFGDGKAQGGEVARAQFLGAQADQ